MVYTTKRDREGAKDVGDVRMARRMRRAGNIVTWDDVDATTSTDGPTAIELPPWLLRDRVFEYLVAPPIMYVTDGVANPKRYERALGPLRAVCQQWQKLVQFLLKEAQLRVKVIDKHTSTPTVLKRMVNEGATNGSAVEELTLVMGRWNPYGTREFSTYWSLDTGPFRATSWWNQFFRSYANVLRLDLSLVSIECLESVLPAAAASCPSLQVLLLQAGRQYNSVNVHASTTASIVQALEGWYNHNGGLLMLSCPWWIQESADLCRDFVEAVAAFCPHLQCLYEDHDSKPHTYIRAPLPLDVWTRFCMNCTQLRKLSWYTGEMTREEMQAAIVAPKPCLTEARIQFTWNRAGSTRNLSLVVELVQACPRLQVLELIEKSACVECRDTATWELLAGAIAAHCPDLETVSIRLLDGMTIPAQFFDALATKRLIRDVFLPLRLTGSALHTALHNIRPASRYPHKLRLLASDSHHAVLKLLQSLESDPSLNLADVMVDWKIHPAGYGSLLMIPEADLCKFRTRIKRRFASADFHLDVSAAKLCLRINCSQLRVA